MVMRHNLLTEDWRHIVGRAGISSSVEPAIRSLPGAQAAPGVRLESRGDALFALSDRLTVVDISVVHPAAPSYVRYACTPGGAAARRDQAKVAKYQTADPNGYAFTPLSHETYGRLGKPAMQLLNTVAIAASANGVVLKGDFVSNALRQLSITLCRGNGTMFRRGLNVLAKVTGNHFRAGLTVPTADVD
jgi:hypothetical protein